MRKFLSVLLAMAMVLSLTVTSFAADTAADAKAEMAGKTVILHTNDVHGAVEGYATSHSSRPTMRPRGPRSSSSTPATSARARPMSAPPRALMRSR